MLISLLQVHLMFFFLLQLQILLIYQYTSSKPIKSTKTWFEQDRSSKQKGTWENDIQTRTFEVSND